MTTTSLPADPRPSSTASRAWQWTAPSRGALAAGVVAGFLVAGLGSRAVMRIIAIADPSADGALTQDQFIVGEMTLGDTVGLVLLGTFVGGISGLIYLGLRRWMPVPLAMRGIAFGYGSLVTGGALLINPENVDFRIFEPVLLPIGLFAALFLAGGFLLATLTDRFHGEPSYEYAARAPRIVAALLVLVTLAGTVLMAGGIIELVDHQGSCISANTDFECVPSASE